MDPGSPGALRRRRFADFLLDVMLVTERLFAAVPDHPAAVVAKIGQTRASPVRGDQDRLAFNGSQALAGEFEKHGIKHELHVSGSGHTWSNGHHYLNELVPKLFG
jgi:hypothetical protein